MIYVLVVLYNSDIKKIDIFSQNINSFYIDNSINEKIKQVNCKFSKENNINYIDMEGNKGLSKAYNKAIETIKPTEEDYIVIFDQDTKFDCDIFDKYINYIEKNPKIDVICPLVEDSIGFLSPCLIKKSGFEHIHNKEHINDEYIDNYSFINSGMCIKGRVFSEIKYDENLFLDFIDHDFIFSLKKNNFKIGICPEILLYQEFSGVTKNSFEQDYNRFKIYVKDAKYYYSKNFDNSYFFKILKRAIKLCLVHRKLVFLLDLFK